MILLINYSHKWWYKALSVLLVVALILAISFGAAPQAHAVGVLTITVCAAILAVMAGAGIATVCAGMTSNDIQSWMQEKLEEWDLYRNDGNIFSDLIQNNLITATVKGSLAIGNAAARGISDFITWLKTELNLTDNSSNSIISGFYNLNGYNLMTVPFEPDSTLLIRETNNVPNAFYWYVDSYYHNLIFIATQPNLSAFIKIGRYSYTFNIQNGYEGYYYLVTSLDLSNKWNLIPDEVKYYQVSPQTIIGTGNNSISDPSSLSISTGVINIPSVDDDGQTDIIIGIDGVYPGATTEEAADVIMDGVLDNTLDTTMTVTDEYVDAVEAVVINELPISVNTDHHMIGFTNLPDFVNLNLNSIWHYVSDAVEYASGFISWFVNLLSSVPTLAIPLYMSFTLLIVLSFIRRILL